MALLIVFSAITTARSADSAEAATICKIVAEKDDHYRVIYQAAKREHVTIQFTDNNNQVVYAEDFKSSGFVKRFDLTHLPVGSYQLKVKSASQEFQERIKLGDVSGFSVSLTPQSKREIAFVGSHEQGKKLTLFILDGAKEVVYKENFDDTRQIHKKYNFEKLHTDQVSFVLYHKDQLIKEQKFDF